MSRYEAPSLQVIAPDGIGEVTRGVDLARVLALTAATCDWPDGARGLAPGDVIVVTSKVVAKAEGRVVPAADRRATEAAETVEVLAEVPGGARIVRNRHGVVLAAAGIDESNTADGTVVLWPTDPDAAARELKAGVESALTVTPLAVIVTDTLGRAWRNGQVDTAIGVAGIDPLLDLAGSVDSHGRRLDVTAPAVADEVAAMADLVKGKAAGRPVAFVRGLAHLVGAADGPGAEALVRPLASDLFAQGSDTARRAGLAAAVGNRRTIRTFRADDVPDDLIRAAVADAINAPAPHHTTPWRFVQVKGESRTGLLDEMQQRWRSDLATLDGFDAEAVARRVRRGDVLRDAPTLVIPFVALAGAAHAYPDQRRRSHERDLFVLSGGAAVQNFMIAVAARGAATAWVSSTVFCPDVVAQALAVPPDWQPLGAIAVGYAAQEPAPRPTRTTDGYLTVID